MKYNDMERILQQVGKIGRFIFYLIAAKRKIYHISALIVIIGNIELLGVIDVSTGAPTTASLVGVASLSIRVRDINTHVERSTITWGTQMLGSGWRLAERYIVIFTTCNYLWRLDIYTNNVTAQTGYQRGGLLSTTTTTVRVPVGWVVSCATVSITNLGEPGELITNTIHGSTTSIQAPWRYLKDKGDLDDPNTTAWNESWSAAYNGKYTTVAYGVGNIFNLPYGITGKSPLYIYLEGEFLYVMGKMFYSSTIWFDLSY